MKKRKLNLKGKILVGIVAMFIIVGLGNVYRTYHEQQINNCIKAGHTEKYCLNGLNK